MEILNILYNNNLIAVYLIGAILVVILIFIVISSMTTTKNDDNKILKDPTEEEKNSNILESITDIKEEPRINDLVENINQKSLDTNNEKIIDTPKINDLVEDLYQKSLEIEVEEEKENNDLNLFLEMYEVPENIIKEVAHNDSNDEYVNKIERKEENIGEIETPLLKEEKEVPKENIEDMLKRLYDLRQNEKDTRKNALLTEIYELKKQVDEALKSNNNEYELDYNYIDTKALADYYLFNEDIEFPKLK